MEKTDCNTTEPLQTALVNVQTPTQTFPLNRANEYSKMTKHLLFRGQQPNKQRAAGCPALFTMAGAMKINNIRQASPVTAV